MPLKSGYGKLKLHPDARMNRAAAHGAAAKLYVNSGQPVPAAHFARTAAHEVSSRRMRKAIARGGGGGEVSVRAYTRSAPTRKG